MSLHNWFLIFCIEYYFHNSSCFLRMSSNSGLIWLDFLPMYWWVTSVLECPRLADMSWMFKFASTAIWVNALRASCILLILLIPSRLQRPFNDFRILELILSALRESLGSWLKSKANSVGLSYFLSVCSISSVIAKDIAFFVFTWFLLTLLFFQSMCSFRKSTMSDILIPCAKKENQRIRLNHLYSTVYIIDSGYT